MSSSDGWPVYGAAAGAAAIVLYLAGALVIGTPPDFDAPGLKSPPTSPRTNPGFR